MHTIKLLLIYYLNMSVQAANLSDCRIESKLFLSELECSISDHGDERAIPRRHRPRTALVPVRGVRALRVTDGRRCVCTGDYISSVSIGSRPSAAAVTRLRVSSAFRRLVRRI